MSFEEDFFGHGNRLRWDAIRSGALPQNTQDRLEPFLDELRLNGDVLVLPRVFENGSVQWYVLCSSSRTARVARDQLMAFVGPSYSTFDGRPASLDPNDSIDAAVLACYGHNVFKVDVPSVELVDVVRERLRLMIALRKERPLRTSPPLRPVGRLLRDFEYSLLTRSDEQAAALIAQLRSEGHLSATNLLFLEVRRLAADRQWDAIMALPELDSLVAMPRPKRVTEAVVQAIYETRLREYEVGRRAEEAVARFRKEIYPRFQELYGSRATLKGEAIDPSFVLAASAADPPRYALVSELLEARSQATPEGAYLAALAQFVRAREEPFEDVFSKAKRAFADGEVDEAFVLAAPLPASFERTALLLRCARDIGTIAAAGVALEAVDALELADRERLDRNVALGKIKKALEGLLTEGEASHLATAPDLLPSNWPSWLERLKDPRPWTGAVFTAEIGAREWEFGAFVTNHTAVADLARLLLEVTTEWGVVALRDSLPYLLEFCVREGADRRLKAVYESLFLVMATDDHVSVPQVAALLTVVDVRLQLGVSNDEYRDATHMLGDAMAAVHSPAVAEVALDAIEILVNSACPAESDRQAFVITVAAMYRRWYRRINRDQVALLRLLADEVGVPLDFPAESSESGASADAGWMKLRGIRVSLYSLHESALRRVKAVLVALCPAVRVDAHSDHVGSPALKAAASAADLFVVATAAAKHAATTFIEANRPKHLRTVYARGQGSSSLLQAIREELSRGGTDAAVH